MTSFRIFILLLCCHLITRAGAGGFQTDGDSSAHRAPPHAFLTVISDVRPFRIYLDTAFLGLTPIDSAAVPVGQHLLRSVPLDPLQWEYFPVIDTLRFTEGQLIEKHVRFQRLVRVASRPFGASVRENGRVLGETPLEVPLEDSTRCLLVSKPGFQDLLSCVRGDTLLTLAPTLGSISYLQPAYLSQNSSQNLLPVYVTAALAVAAGAGSAYWKIKADNLNIDYTNTGNTADLSRIHHYDTLAGISLVICQVNLLGLAYFLFTR